MEREANNHSPFQALPEECIANIISFITPRDACKLSLVSKIFRSAAKSDTVWERFLPSDFHSIISQSHSSSSLLASSSKKELYFTLCDKPIIIHDGKKSFQLDRRSWKKCYMLASRDLSIVYGDSPLYWNWTTLPESRFEEVAKLVGICCLEIHGKISTRLLSLKTHYSAYLVFKVIDGFCVGHHPAEVTVRIVEAYSSTRNVYLDPTITDERRRLLGLPCPEVRNDGWLEIKMGDFFNLEGEDDQVNMSVVDKDAGIWKTGFVLQGIEVRPREDNLADCFISLTLCH